MPAELISFDPPQLGHLYNYGQATCVEPLNLGVKFKSITGVQLELSGTQTLGFWVGDGVEDHSVGPKGGDIYAQLDYSTAPFTGSYPEWHYDAECSGSFTATLNFNRWNFLYDGVTNIYLTNSLIYGWGQFTTPPVFDLTDVKLIINGMAVLEPSALLLFLTATAVFGCTILRHLFEKTVLK